ncbi:Aste57867_16510 [Aphanomyces stellatus]|uniref:Aste57867_16510 protein n=1 Tax=Aphanomyces stellatus TaxID=120398 RepID=A0A485L5L6_9STRA|nr:hypothetical protein As57867_016453 [Aphanomyces stellatus]VFT93284.1 Aste57867_16510 [Aphanomyces stellatus]
MATVVLDAANVATVTAGNLRVERLEAALDYFGRCNVRCIAFAPRYWVDGTHLFPDDASKAKLTALVDQDKLVLTPPQAHDDFYVIDYATKHDGFVVSNDMFRDHVMNQRRFNGQTLTTAWVKSRCIDFTFVGLEFLPNSQLMDKVLRYEPASTQQQTAVVVPPPSSAPLTLANPQSISDDMHCDFEDVEMGDVSAAPNNPSKRVVDMSEAVYIEVPMAIVTILHDNDDAGLKYFQDLSGTYMVLPRTVPFGKETTTLSIHGNRECCERAMHAVHAFLHDYVRSTMAQPQHHSYSM